MGALATVVIRPGVEFTPDAAAAFRRAEAQVQREFGRNIGVNSTYRSWDQQMSMYDAWNAYVGGWGPYPGHSKAVHPSESFHVSGLALDSDDWRNARIVQILAENGFIRNRLYVPNEEHHFEYIRARDKNHGKPAGSKSEEDDMDIIHSNGKEYGIAPGFISHLGSAPHSAILQKTAGKTVTKLANLDDLARTLDNYGIPRSVLNGSGLVLNPESGKYESNGLWSWVRANKATLDKLAKK